MLKRKILNATNSNYIIVIFAYEILTSLYFYIYNMHTELWLAFSYLHLFKHLLATAQKLDPLVQAIENKTLNIMVTAKRLWCEFHLHTHKHTATLQSERVSETEYTCFLFAWLFLLCAMLWKYVPKYVMPIKHELSKNMTLYHWDTTHTHCTHKGTGRREEERVAGCV